MDTQTKHDLLYKPLAVGATGAAMSTMLVPMSENFYGMPAPITLGLTMGAASWVSAMTNEYVYENIMPEEEGDLVYNTTAPLITGAASIVAMYALVGSQNMDSGAIMYAGLLGVAAEIGGSYVDESLLAPAMKL